MLLNITSKRQVTFQKKVMEKLHLHEGDTLLVSETKEGVLIKPQCFEFSKLAPLKDKVPSGLPAPNIESIRHAALDPNLRD